MAGDAAWRDALARLVDDLDLRRACSDNARRMVAEVFDMDRLVERRSTLLGGLLRS